MRVLLWTEGFWPHIGGASILAAQYALRLKARGHDCRVITTRHDSRLPVYEEYGGIPVHRFPVSQALVARDLRLIKAMSEQIAALKAEFQPDVVHVNECGPGNFLHLRTTASSPAPTLFTVQSILPESSPAAGLMVQMFESADWVGTVSQAMLDDLRRLAPQIAPRSSVIYDGLERPDLQPAPLTPADYAAPRLLCAGRVVYDKGFDVALKAFVRVNQRHPRARLFIAGEGTAKSDLQALAKDLGIASAVEFTGWVEPDRIPALINTMALVVMPSRWREPFGLVAVQAGQMARPIVATRVGGLPEIVADGETGLLVENEDDAALAQAIDFLLDHPDTARQMGLAARERVLTRFSIERYVEEYEALYAALAPAAQG